MTEIKRIAYEDLDPALKETLRPKVERLGYLGEFFAVGGHQPDSTRLFQEFTESLKAALPSELTEAVALGVASTLGNGYEQAQHERLASKLGFPDEWIAAAIGRGDESVMSEAARAARSLALTMVAGYGRDAAGELSRTVDVLGEEVAVGVLLTVGRYVAHAVIANTLELAPPVKTVVPAAGA
ncbi:MAG TPA: carboxymuconolactone decarboxylase family protein [Acidimicrobiales bacterium]|nr:carboxymuconolactone decarboxylase family protein [Acidimicrobiales bacterium]